MPARHRPVNSRACREQGRRDAPAALKRSASATRHVANWCAHPDRLGDTLDGACCSISLHPAKTLALALGLDGGSILAAALHRACEYCIDLGLGEYLGHIRFLGQRPDVLREAAQVIARSAQQALVNRIDIGLL